MTIARIWHGWTTKSNERSYEELLKGTILPDIKEKTGNDLLQVNVLKRDDADNDEVQFISILWFKNMKSIERWFGVSQNVFINKQDYLAAHIPHEARKLLKRWDNYATHYNCIFDSNDKLLSKL